MPEYTNDDRELLGTERTLWNAVLLLDDIRHGGAWMAQIREASDELRELVVKIRDYNDSFEE